MTGGFDETRPMAQTQPTVRAGSADPQATVVTTPMTRPEIPEVALDAELGRGGMGVVYRGRQTYLNRTVAVKVLKPDIGGEEYTARFRREATLLAGLAHPHIVACHHAGALADGSCFLVMEFIDGPNLWQHVRAHGALTPAAVVRVIRDIAAALGYAQGKGIIHRDVKAENILLAPGGGDAAFPFTAKLVDLGLARPVAAIGDAALTRQGVLLGTPSTMAPEQFDNPEGVDHRADMYGLGCAAFQALTGEAAFRGNSLMDIVAAKASGVIPDPLERRRDCPPAIAALIRRLLARRPEDRFATYDELIAACSTTASATLPSTAPSRRPLLAVGAIIALCAGGAIIWSSRSATAPIPLTTAGTAGASESNSEPSTATAPPVGEPFTTAPPAAIKPPTTVTNWRPWQPMHGEEPVTGLADWEVTAGWGLAEEEAGLVGNSRDRAVLRKIIAEPAWRVRGRFGPVGTADYHEAGIQVTVADGGTVQAVVLNLGPTRLLAVVRLQADGSIAERLHDAALTAPPPWDFQVTVVGAALTWSVANASGTTELTAAAAGVGLVVSQGAVMVQELAISQPEP